MKFYFIYRFVCPFYRPMQKICEPIREKHYADGQLYDWHLQHGFCYSITHINCCSYQQYQKYLREKKKQWRIA